MLQSNSISMYIILFFFTLGFVLIARQVAIKIGLVDKPNKRKRHFGLIPLVGGISIYAGICFYFLFHSQQIEHAITYLVCAGVLVVLGAFDDRFDISVRLRILVQTVVAVVMMMVAGLHLNSLGMILGPWELTLGRFGYVITILAVLAAINAFNMVDGIDGLLGGLSSVTFGAMGVLFYLDHQSILAGWCLAIIMATLPYILFNLGVFGQQYKVFMGDAGSTLIGFTVIWMLLQGTQGTGHPMEPVTALWLIAIPLMDMVATMYRRISKGISPFSADRQHLHHILMRSGFSPRQSLVLITTVASILAAIGVIGENILSIPEWIMFLLFLLLFSIYGYCLKRAWRFARFLKRFKRRYL